uniref:Uncharacterized protein n=1 Tax=Faecalibaculum rodentium TaxID=1702221 RepID=A0A140DTE6_9FIRM|nr:hypothetical protein AALO17_07890 [Faecalibaculum rodentium]
MKRLCFTSLDGLTIALFSHGCKKKPKFLQNFLHQFSENRQHFHSVFRVAGPVG